MNTGKKPLASFLSFLLVAALSESVAAQTPSSPLPASPAPVASDAPLTVEQAVNLALQSAPRLSAAQQDVEAARFGVGASRALTGPLIAFVPGITSLSGTGEELLIQQPLEINGTRSARTMIAAAQLRSADARTSLTRQEIVFQTRTAYFELSRARALQRVAGETLKSAEEIDRIMRRQVELGSRPGIEAIQTAIEFTRAQQQVVLTASEEEVARAALNTLLGRATDTGIGLLLAREASRPGATGAAAAASPSNQTIPKSTSPPTVPRTITGSTDDNGQVVQQALSNRPELRLAQNARAVFEGEAGLARAQGRFDIAPQFRAGSVLRGFRDYGLGMAVSLPFIDYGARRSRIRQAETSTRAETNRIAAVERLVRQEVAQALTRERAALTAVAAYEGGILQQSRRLLDASRTGFEAGQTGILALLEAQRTYRAVQTEYTNALATLDLARAARDRATGTVPLDLGGQDTTRTNP